MSRTFFTWLLLFIGVTLVFQSLFPQAAAPDQNVDDFVLKTIESSYSRGEIVELTISNNLEQSVLVPSNCPANPLRVERYENGAWEQLNSEQGIALTCGEGVEPSSTSRAVPEFLELTALSTYTLDFAPWKDELFADFGKYRVSLDVELGEEEKTFITEFDVEERGFFSSVAYELFFRPIFNFLLFLISVLPDMSFGLAVIALTVIIRLILLVPNQKALKSQRAMMKIQPQLEEIKKKYKGDQQRISQETMALWQKHKVNPVGGCLPMLIQLPILIALFYVVRAGFTPYQAHMVYPFLAAVDLSQVNSHFFGILELNQINATWLPLFVGLLQFTQLKMSFSRKVGKKKSKVLDIDEKGKVKPAQKQSVQDSMQMMSKYMLYFMPVMIAFMVASLPAAVGLYLAVSTVFGIAQQYAVNRNTP